jgi:hypothetical protein
MHWWLRVLPIALLIACSGPQDPATSPDASQAASDGAIDATEPTPTCTGEAPGAYCGNDLVTGGDPGTLYECPGAGAAPTAATPCADGCVVEAAGIADHCHVPVADSAYTLPWPDNVSMRLTQDCNDSCCSDHVGNDEWAWDFANAGAFPVIAARGGTITHLKINSTTGCGTSSCASYANVIVIDHGDGTQSTYLHLQGGSLAAGISCGATVERGQLLATSGTTGWSTGIHLHYQVSKVHANAPTCECGSDGTGCATSTVPWSSFWVTSAYPTVPIDFEDWPTASACANRRIQLP